MKAVLYLEDGSLYEGQKAGCAGEVAGEVVFNTSLVGYQEILTDPSYNGQLVVMTYPIIGSYGVNISDNESNHVWAKGFIMREICDEPSNWQSTETLRSYLERTGTVAISGIDTRSVTKKIRDKGSMLGIISTECFDTDELKNKLNEHKKHIRNYITEASIKEGYVYCEGSKYNITAIDLGIKQSILEGFKELDVKVTVLPSDATIEQIMGTNPDALFLSNGPGDPKDAKNALELAKEFIGKIPVLGICLGHQIIGLALGFDSFKLKFGHHGGNHPVKDIKRNKVIITSQNHNYALKEADIKDVEITHINLNDNTIEGIRHKKLPVLSVQYHPEAAPGPQDSRYIYKEFLEVISDYKNK